MGVWSFLLYPNHSRTIQLLFHFCWSSDDMLSFSHVSSVHSPIPGSWVIRSRSSWSEAFAKMSSLSEEKSTEAPSESARKFGMFQKKCKASSQADLFLEKLILDICLASSKDLAVKRAVQESFRDLLNVLDPYCNLLRALIAIMLIVSHSGLSVYHIPSFATPNVR